MPMMTSPLDAKYYADDAISLTAEILENVRIAQDTYRLRVACPEIAQLACPGQFVMLRLSQFNDPLIGRPLALYDTYLDKSQSPLGLDVVYLVAGKLTRRLAQIQPGQFVEIWGPLGNGFLPAPVEHLVMVAGGIGQTPFLALAKEYLGVKRYGSPPRELTASRKITFCYGARHADLLAGVEDFESLGIHVRIATEDGSRGHQGRVTDLLQEILVEEDPHTKRIVCCGPEPMMEAVAQIAESRDVPCQVSLETPMACGIGICFTCVAKVHTQDGQWDYKRTCVEGPVFDARDIQW